jgi:hypothetical protein
MLLAAVLAAEETDAVAADPSGGALPINRLSLRVLDSGKVHPIIMSPGMITMIELPAPCTGHRTGSPETDLKVIRPAEPNNEVDLILQRGDARPTNLILRAGKQKYFFDIIPYEFINPSKPQHQDYLGIIGSVGRPSLDESEDDDAVVSSASPSLQGRIAGVSGGEPGQGAGLKALPEPIKPGKQVAVKPRSTSAAQIPEVHAASGRTL